MNAIEHAPDVQPTQTKTAADVTKVISSKIQLVLTNVLQDSGQTQVMWQILSVINSVT